MSIAKITMIGLETALAYRNESLFDLMNLPDGIDIDTVKNNILLEAGDFEVLYADPNFMKQAVGIWSAKHYRTFDKWIKALNIDYNPLENYDRFERWDNSANENSSTNRQGTTSDTSNASMHNEGTDHDSEHNSGNVHTENSGTTENEVSAFDSSSYQPESQNIVNNEESTNNSNDRTLSHNSSNDTNTSNTSNGSSTDEETFEKGTNDSHTGWIHGNIGVTTSQQMLQSELDIARFNIVQQITDLFLQEFCIMIYS